MVWKVVLLKLLAVGSVRKNHQIVAEISEENFREWIVNLVQLVLSIICMFKK